MLKQALLLGTAAVGCYAFAPTMAKKAWYSVNHRPSTGSLYLTFDDGPDPTYTPALLDLLQRYRLHASFFVVADFAAEYPHLIHRMVQEGHLVGFHSCRHCSAYLMPPAATARDFSAGIRTLHQLGVPVTYYRPPWGVVNLASMAQAKRYGLKTVLWHVMAQDWSASITAEEIVRRLRERTKPGSIICLHDGRGEDHAPSRTIRALEVMLPEWLSQGYHFQTVDHYG